MDLETIKFHLEMNRPALEQWSLFIKNRIIQGLKDDFGYGDDIVPSFIKIDPKPRLKTIESALGKVARKGYSNPIRQISDLIGIRFVVLLSSDIQKIVNIIRAEEGWNVSIARDYKHDIDKNPKIFDYQSQHFDISPKKSFEINGVIISTDINCEVQIRTLLQHAYAELVHDNIYKSESPVPSKAERQVAKSMALMETTDDLFCLTMCILEEANSPKISIFKTLTQLYKEKIGSSRNIHVKSNYIIIEQFLDLITETGFHEDMQALLSKKKFIDEKILSRKGISFLFSQPIIYFVYLIVYTTEDTNIITNNWPLPGSYRDLGLVLSDLGKKEFDR